MVLIILPILFAIWAFFFLPYAEKIPIWLKWKNPKRARWILIILFSLLPFGDEIIGRVQFAYLCNKGDLLYVDPNIKNYEKLVRSSNSKKIDLHMMAMPIRGGVSYIVSPSSGKVIISTTRFLTRGGFFYRNLTTEGKIFSCPKATSASILHKNGFTYTRDGVYVRDNKNEIK